MKNNKPFQYILAIIFIAVIVSGCSKLLDKRPVTQIVTTTDSTSITAADAENLISGVYNSEIGYSYGLEFNVLDRITNGDVRSDNCYAGGDNPDNISIDLFTDNALNGNIARDWNDAFGII